MSSPTPAVAPYVPTYATRVPYLTRAEFLAAPTGVDCSQLIPGGTTQANGAALDTLLASASSYADTITQQVLAATIDTQAGVYRLRSDGTIRVPVDYTPLIEVTAVAVGSRPTNITALTDLSALWLDRKVVRIPACTVTAPGREVFAKVTYVNGFTNTTLAANAAQAGTSIQVTSALGVFPGLMLTIYSDAAAATEIVTVAPSYVQGSTTVPLVTALVSAHTAGDSVSALPRAIKQATICLASHLVKTRGAESIAINGLSGGPADVVPAEAGYTEEYQQAVDLLATFRRVR